MIALPDGTIWSQYGAFESYKHLVRFQYIVDGKPVIYHGRRPVDSLSEYDLRDFSRSLVRVEFAEIRPRVELSKIFCGFFFCEWQRETRLSSREEYCQQHSA